MKTQLTSRERVARMFARQDHDRIRGSTSSGQTVERWRSEGMTGEPAELFDWDFEWCSWVSANPYPGREEIIEEDDETRVVIGAWGQKTRGWKHKAGTPEHLGWECQSAEDWFERLKPQLTRERQPDNSAEAKEKFDAARSVLGKWTVLCGIQSYEAMKAMCGDEVMLMAFAAEPDWVRDVSRTYTDLQLLMFQGMIDAGIQADALWIFEDLAFSNGPLCSPDMYRDLVWPDHKRMCEFAHAHGMKFIFHTDGDVNTYMDLFVEGGFDCLQPLEAKARVDIRQLAPRYNRDLAFFGNIDMMVAITNDRDRVEHEMREKLAAGMAGKAYMYHSDHSVPPQVSWETYQWMMECVEKYGTY